MKNFNQDYKTELYKTIEEIENNSLVEIVVIAKSKSDNYRAESLWFGFGFLVFVYTFFMFIPIDFDVYAIYLITIASFFIGYFLHFLVDPLRRMAIKKQKMQKRVEIMARAIFQKGGMRHTKNKIGILFFVSVFEKIVYILPDTGAETAIPDEEWKILNEDFNLIFNAENPALELIKKLNSTTSIFSKYIPSIENDINELPDDLNVDL